MVPAFWEGPIFQETYTPAPVQQHEFDEGLTLQQLAEAGAPVQGSAKKRLQVDLHSGPKLAQNMLTVTDRFWSPAPEPRTSPRRWGPARHRVQGTETSGLWLWPPIEGPFGCNAGKMFNEQLGVAGETGCCPLDPWACFMPARRQVPTVTMRSHGRAHNCEFRVSVFIVITFVPYVKPRDTGDSEPISVLELRCRGQHQQQVEWRSLRT